MSAACVDTTQPKPFEILVNNSRSKDHSSGLNLALVISLSLVCFFPLAPALLYFVYRGSRESKKTQNFIAAWKAAVIIAWISTVLFTLVVLRITLKGQLQLDR